MLLTKVLENFYSENDLGLIPEIDFKHITLDSRNIKKGSVFIALEGINATGRDYVDAAISNGAVVVLVESDENMPDYTIKSISEIPVIYLPNLRANSGKILAEVNDNPSKYLKIVAVTGTNGKTTIAHFLTQALNFLDTKTGYIGTLGYGRQNKMQPLSNTTPGIEELHKILQEFYLDKFESVALEASSHAIAQSRLSGLNLNAAIFTNLTHEHLDYHKNIDEYAETKFKLFTETGIKIAIVNTDDKYGKKLHKKLLDNKTVDKLYSYSLTDKSADIHLEQAHYVKEGTDLVVESPWGRMTFSVKIHADYNISNIMAVYTYLCSIGIHQEQAIKAITKLKSPPGRFNYLRFSKYSDVVIDYAHTPNALECLLKGVKKHMNNTKIKLVFGCGGNRDKKKRPEMGMIAAKYADNIIITSDNPRDEDPESIIKEIAAGIISRPSKPIFKKSKTSTKPSTSRVSKNEKYVSNVKSDTNKRRLESGTKNKKQGFFAKLFGFGKKEEISSKSVKSSKPLEKVKSIKEMKEEKAAMKEVQQQQMEVKNDNTGSIKSEAATKIPEKEDKKDDNICLKDLDKTKVSYEVDRYKAISKAIKTADRNDLVIIAGKGQETTQEIKGELKEFSDEKVVKEIIKGM